MYDTKLSGTTGSEVLEESSAREGGCDWTTIDGVRGGRNGDGVHFSGRQDELILLSGANSEILGREYARKGIS